MTKHCYCTQVKSDGHDWICRNHPRFAKHRISDKQRLDWLSKRGVRTIKSVAPQGGNSGSLGWSYDGRDFILHAKEGRSLRQTIDESIRRETRK